MIRIAVALLNGSDGRTLVVRKRGTSTFIQPGGKIEPGEAPAAAVCRELGEELGLVVEPERLRFLGRFSGPAVNEPGEVEADVFELDSDEPIRCAAEIEEAVWIDPMNPGPLVLAPLTRDAILPLHPSLQRRGTSFGSSQDVRS